jgi:hypothetical protein
MTRNLLHRMSPEVCNLSAQLCSVRAPYRTLHRVSTPRRFDPLSPGDGENAGQLRQRLSVSLDRAEQER